MLHSRCYFGLINNNGELLWRSRIFQSCITQPCPNPSPRITEYNNVVSFQQASLRSLTKHPLCLSFVPLTDEHMNRSQFSWDSGKFHGFINWEVLSSVVRSSLIHWCLRRSLLVPVFLYLVSQTISVMKIDIIMEGEHVHSHPSCTQGWRQTQISCFCFTHNRSCMYPLSDLVVG